MMSFIPTLTMEGGPMEAPGLTLRAAGGYTGMGRDDLPLTEKARRVEIKAKSAEDCAAGQFDIADDRSPQEIETLLRKMGLDPVWKDWDEAILTP